MDDKKQTKATTDAQPVATDQAPVTQPTPVEPAPVEQAPVQPAPAPEAPQPAQPLAQPVQPIQPPQPVVKKPMPKWLLPVIFGSVGAIVLIICAIIFIPMMFKVDYAETYKVAKEIKYDGESGLVSSDYACESVINYVNNNSYDEDDYNDYISECENYINETVDTVTKLENTEAIKKDKDLKTQFNDLKTLAGITNGENEKVKEALPVYKAYHSFVASKATSGKDYDEITDDELAKKVEPLINSGNDTLKKYGEGYKEKAAVFLAAAREKQKCNKDMNCLYYIGDNPIRAAYEKADKEFDDYIAKNKPEMTKLMPISLPDNTKLQKAFSNLYDTIRSKYQENYNEKDGLCSKLFGQVICE